MVNVENGAAGNKFQALKSKLQQRRKAYLDASEDPILNEIKMVGNDDGRAVEILKVESSQIQADLDHKIAMAKEACQVESGVLADLSNNLQGLQQSRDKLLQDMDEIDQRQLDLQHQIALHQQEASEEMEVIDSVEEERKREVPRLKHSISLYASTTGIKWDFLQDEILSGSVVSTLRWESMYCRRWGRVIMKFRQTNFFFFHRLFQIDMGSNSFRLTPRIMILSRLPIAYGISSMGHPNKRVISGE